MSSATRRPRARLGSAQSLGAVARAGAVALILLGGLGAAAPRAHAMGAIACPADLGALKGPDPWQVAGEEERLLHAANTVKLQNEQTDAATRSTIGHRDCGNDRGCNQRVVDEYRAATRAISNKKTEENGRHEKRLREIALSRQECKSQERLEKR